MNYTYRYIAFSFCWLTIAFLMTACGAATSVISPTQIPAKQMVTYTPIDCIKADWTYRVTIPAQWRSVPTEGCEVQFQDSTVPAAGTIPADDSSESEFFVGGIGVRGKIDVTSAEADGVAWVSMQPNHSNIVEWQPINTPIGPGRVYTLDRDRASATWSMANPTWRGQYTYIPKGDISYEIWVQVDKKMQGKIDPTLSQMLESLVVPNGKS